MDTNRKGVTAFLMAVFLAGCSAQQTIEQPATALPQTFSSQQTTAAAHNTSPWWLDLDDEQLNRLIDQALDNNFNLKATISKVRQAEALAIKAGASLTPSLDLTGDAARNFQTGPDYNNFQLGLRASYEIDLWSRLRAAEQGGQLDYLASRENLEVTALSLTADVADRWYALLTQIALEELYIEQLATLEHQLQVIEFRFHHGQNPAEDVLQQQQQIENLNARLSSAKYQQDIIKQQLALLLGQSQWHPTSLAINLPDLPPLPETGLPSDIASRRPDLKQAWFQLQSQQQNLIIAEADRLPQIRLSASILSSTRNLPELFDDWAGSLAASLTAPLFDGKLRKAEVVRQKNLLEESVNSYSQKVLSAFGEIENALTREASQQHQWQSTHQQLSFAQQAEDIKWTRYRNGGGNFLDVLSARRSRIDLEQQLVQSHGQLLAERVTLHRAIAGDIAYAEHVFSEDSGNE